ncbi:MAG TPA: ABC transporter permease [Vicinamibacterales bacterium]|nr:ABC transporter permease [Vicinamibacterales bacterium]
MLLHDFRHALRTLFHAPGLTALVIASLAIGIGANTAMFSVANALLLKPLPYPDPDHLAILWLRSPGVNIPQDWPSPGQYIDLQAENHSFQEMSISQGRSGTLLGVEQPEQVEALRTSSSLFHLLGATPLYGRLLLAEDDTPGKGQVVILSHAFWKRLFNADPGVIGRVITLNGFGDSPDGSNQYTVVGILRPGFVLNDEVMPTVASITRMDVFLPLPFGADAVRRRGDENYNLMARLKTGVTMEQAQADVSVIAGHIRDKDKRDKTFTISVVSLADQVVGDVRRGLLVLLGSVAMVLLIACANVANLLLARASGRHREIAIRAALGAGRHRLVRQLLTESVLLGLSGGAAGLFIAEAAIAVLRAVKPGNIPRAGSIAIDGSVLAFTFVVSVATGIVFGLAPAFRAASLDLNAALKSGGRGGHDDAGFGTSRRKLRSLLVVSEVAFALMLLIGASLLVRSFVRLQEVSPGFDVENVISMRVGASGRSFESRQAAIEFYRTMWERVAAVPGVKIQGAVSALPFTSSVGWGGINVEGFIPQPGQELQVDQRGATSDYFRTMNIPLVKGRFFSDFDTAPGAEPAAIVDEKFARRFWPNENPIGKHVWNDPKRQVTIVGVVGTVKQYGLDIDGRIVVYRPTAGLLPYVVARSVSSDPASVAGAIARAIHDSDPTIPIYDVRTMRDRLRGSLARQRFSTIMLGGFALFALILAAVGVYGVMSYLVTQGTRDIGVRMALGAQRGTVLGLVLRQGLVLTGAGVAAGLVGAAALTRLMASLLFGIGATDAVTFSTVPLVLIAVAFLACYLPALRATRVDPVVALRNE